MIRYLAIRNLAVIESVAVEFEPSFNILTGETGAGKSILVEAVGLLLGGRATQDLLRTGEELATVEAVFEDADGREIVVRREITSQGRSRGFINGALATAAALRDLSNSLVELHGQHEHQQLLDPAQHLFVLDAWGHFEPAREQVSGAFARAQAIRQQIDRLRMDDRERAARLELVEFQLSELARAALTPGEDETLMADRQILRSADRVQQLCHDSYAELYDAEHAVLAALDHVWKRVGELAAFDARFVPHLESRDAIKAQLEDLAFTLRDFAAGIDASPGRLQEVEDRLALLERLKRKHGPSLDEVIARRDALAREQAALVGGTSSLAELDAALARASEEYLGRARDLSARRHRVAGDLARRMEGELADLAMDHARFEVRLTTTDGEGRWTDRGLDEAEFFLSANVGEDPRPLARIASGGELSRVMLALKTLAAAGAGRSAGARTLIFDEVDAGIGGRVASMVGQKLASLGERYQVLCITHLPQVAACGRTHFVIQKATRGRRTVTSVRALTGPERVDELARMMGGAAAGNRARGGAQELLDAAEAKGEQSAKAKGESPRERKRK
ncbi:MAG: DNA repair protein RecN [Acidobacteria bacterium]|nr:DNA repair protein RecN [Acidobacteriota bacterium]